MKNIIPTLWRSLVEMLFPRRCPVCGGRILGESCICTMCMSKLPRTLYHLRRGNKLEQRFYGTVPVERATGYFFYTTESPYHQILHQLKYYGHTEMGIYMGHCMATHLMADGGDFLEGIDCIVPVPLSKARKQKRGYNQSELLAQGISQVADIPVRNEIVCRVVDNPTQTHLSNIERWENVKGIFEISPSAMHLLKGKHILLVDDVTTTGATLTSCAQTIFASVPDCRISIAVLAVADTW